MDIYFGLVLSVGSAFLGFLCAYLYVKKWSTYYQSDYVNAQTEFHKRQYQLAIELFNKVLANTNTKNPIYLSSLVGISESYKEIEDYDNAVAYLDKAIKISQNTENELYATQLHKLKAKMQRNKTA